MKKKKIVLSVIVVSFNTKELLQNCINSLLKNCRGIDLEIIVIDNASTDESRKYLHSLVIPNQREKSSDPSAGGERKKKVFRASVQNDIKVILNDRNLGFAKANNQGIRIAKGDYILLLNSDTVVKKGSLKKLVGFAKENNDSSLVAPKLLNEDLSTQPSCYHFPNVFGAIKGDFSKYAPVNTGKVDAVVGAALLIPKKIVDKVGLLDEKYFMYFEDLDFCRRTKKAGFSIYYLSEAEIVHRHGASGKSLKSKPQKWLIQSSKMYHGVFRHYLINFILWLRQKYSKLRKN